MKVVLCRRRAGVGHVPAPGVWPEVDPGDVEPRAEVDDRDRTGLEPSALIFLNAPS